MWSHTACLLRFLIQNHKKLLYSLFVGGEFDEFLLDSNGWQLSSASVEPLFMSVYWKNYNGKRLIEIVATNDIILDENAIFFQEKRGPFVNNKHFIQASVFSSAFVAVHGRAGCLNLLSAGNSLVLLLLDLHLFFPKDAFQWNVLMHLLKKLAPVNDINGV